MTGVMGGKRADAGTSLSLTDLLDVLGYTDAEFVSINHKIGPDDETWRSAVVVPSAAADTVKALPKGTDVWFGVNPVTGPARSCAGRGTADDVTRLAALICDLDVDTGKCPDFPTAHAIIDELSEILGSRPMAITESGHGLQPYWPLSDDQTGESVERAEVKNLLRRFRGLVKVIAAHHGCTADSVFDLPRVLRVPGTVNHKYPANPVAVVTHRDMGKALTGKQIAAALAEFGISEKRSVIADTDLPWFSRKCLINRVRKAVKGFRNTTLYGAAKDAARQGDLDDDLIAELTAAAGAVGLDPCEIAATISSARQSGDQKPATSPVKPEDGAVLLNDLVVWSGRFVRADPDDYKLVALWTISTHMATELYTTARLLIDSIMPESGKTTLIEHLAHLCSHPVQAASVGSPAVLVRLVCNGPRTLLIDEADRVLDPEKPGIGDLLSVLNSGYKRGAKRPASVPDGKGGWRVEEMSTFAPVAMAGNNPHLPDDTRSRSIRVLLWPDRDGTVEDSEWEIIEAAAKVLQDRIARFADQQRETVARSVDLPAGCVGRAKEKWKPLKRVAVAAGGEWPRIADALIARGLQEDAEEREAGLLGMPAGMVMLQDLRLFWPADVGDDELVPTTTLVKQLIRNRPDYWGPNSAYGKSLTEHRFGRIIRQAAKVSSIRPGGRGPRGFTKAAFNNVWRRLGIDGAAVYASGASGESGASGAPNDGAGSAPDAPLQPPAPDSSAGGE